MKPSTQKVLDVMKRDGGITRLVATHLDIGCVRKAISELREHGFQITTVRRADTEGNKYTRWVLAGFSF